MIRLLVLLFSLTILASCKFRPYIKYYFPNKKTEFPKFNKAAQLRGALNENRTNYDVETYDLFLKLFPEKKHIEGVMKIGFRAETTNPTIQLDLLRRLKVEGVSSNVDIREWSTKKDMLFITFKEQLRINEQYNLEVKYHGKPPEILNEGPIMWKEDTEKNSWISSQIQGYGSFYIFPSKDLLYDEPDQTFIRIQVPNSLKVVANGTLENITSEGSRQTFHYKVESPINVYNISFNAGNYVQIDKAYKDILGENRNIEIHALKPNEQEASAFYDQVTMHMAKLEELFGVFPWWEKDGCRFVQTAHEHSAMEHQSAIAMGQGLRNDYLPPDTLHINTTMVHELAHEWWGNSITASDYCDAWIHEGFATYAEALVIEKIYGKSYYDHYFWRYMQRFVANKRPMIKPCEVRYNSWVHDDDQDIYIKGALLLHTLRRQVDDDKKFFQVLKNTTAHFHLRNITSGELVAYFNSQFETDYTSLFGNFFHYSDPPTVEYYYNQESGLLSYRWKTLNEPFDFNITGRYGDRRFAFTPSKTTQNMYLTPGSELEFNIADYGYVVMERIEN